MSGKTSKSNKRVDRVKPVRRMRPRLKDRRKVLGLLLGTGVGLVLLRVGSKERKRIDRKEQKVLITETCAGCSHCAVICPTQAIRIIPFGIAVNDKLCTSCGYCQMSCTVAGIRVIRENHDA